MGWELIGGDPAPGSPDSIGSACAALARIADIAAQAREDLVRQTGAAGIEHWKGSAADAFRADVATLPGDLDTLGSSYREASRALSNFRDVLSTAQADAASALRIAAQAKADRDAAVARRDNARSEVAALTLRHLKAQSSMAALQAQQKLSIDPAQRSSLNTPISAARSQVSRLSGDVNSAKQAASRYQAQIDDADRRLRDAQQRADTVRKTLSAAADRATDAIEQAEREAHLPGWAQEKLERAGAWVTRNAENIKTVLSVVQMVLTVASMVFPVAAPVLMGLSLLCAVAILATDVVKTANSPEGFSAANMWELGGDLLGVIASAAGFGAMLKVASASKGFAAVNTSVQASKDLTTIRTLSSVDKVARWGEDAAQVGEGVAKNGWEGGVTAAGTILLGKGLEKGGGALIRTAANQANGSPAIKTLLDSRSLKLKDADPAPNLTTIDLDGLPSTTGLRSVLESGGTQSDLGAEIGEKYAREMAKPIAREISGLVDGTIQDRLQPEIDIDLNPSPYGATR